MPLTFLLLLLSCTGYGQAQKPIYIDYREVDYIFVKEVNLVFFTPIDISCDELDQHFRDNLDSFVIMDRSVIRRFITDINNADTTAGNSVDTRMTTTVVYKSGKSEQLCWGYLPVFLYNGSLYMVNSDVWKYLKPKQ